MMPDETKAHTDGEENRERVLRASAFTPKEKDAFGMMLGLDGWQLLVNRAFKTFQGERQQLLLSTRLTEAERMVYIGHLEGVLRLLAMPYTAVGESVPASVLAFFRGDL